jgi:UDP-2,3-diacylglucosamine pyrophosphatase LpxH
MTSTREPDAELIVVSDLHLGRGRNPRTGRWYRLEAFFYDDDFAGFCAFLCRDAAARGSKLRLVLAGDVFDLLRVDSDLDGAGPPRFEPVASPGAAAELMSAILAGHPGVVAGLRSVLLAGHEVVFVPGNHDIELQWTVVQERIRSAIAADLPAGADPGAVDDRLRFSPWFHHEAGRIWVEHGSQYDPEGAFRYPLRDPVLPASSAALERDLPLGNFFQRYLFNGFGATAFLVPSSDANQRYMKWMMLHRPRMLARVVARYVPFAFQYLRRLGRSGQDPASTASVQHARTLGELGASSGLGERLLLVDALKQVKTDVQQAAVGTARRIARVFSSATLLALLGAALWYLTIEVPRLLSWDLVPRLLTFLGMSLVVLLLALGGLVYFLLRGDDGPAELGLPWAAERIADIVDVPLVVFGHTHGESVHPLPRHRGWYFNVGTWIGVFPRDVLLPRSNVQYTFLRVIGREPQLLYFDPARGAALPVILLEDESS